MGNNIVMPFNGTSQDNQENNLVFAKNGNFFTTSETIAKGFDVQHKNVLELIEKYQDKIARFGAVAFETLPLQNGGIPKRVALFNKLQSMFFMTLLRNNDLVVDFKVRLVEEFEKLAEQAKTAPTPIIPALPFDMNDPLSIMDWSRQQFLTLKQREETKDAIIAEQSRVIVSQVEHLEANKEIEIFVKQMQESKKSKSFTEISKVLSDAFDYSIGAENLRIFCILKGFLNLNGLPSDKFRPKRYFKVFTMYYENTGDIQIKTRITGNGLMFLSQEVKPYKVFFTLKRAEWKYLLDSINNGGKLRKEFMAKLKDATHYSTVNQNELLV